MEWLRIKCHFICIFQERQPIPSPLPFSLAALQFTYFKKCKKDKSFIRAPLEVTLTKQ